MVVEVGEGAAFEFGGTLLFLGRKTGIAHSADAALVGLVLARDVGLLAGGFWYRALEHPDGTSGSELEDAGDGATGAHHGYLGGWVEQYLGPRRVLAHRLGIGAHMSISTT